MHLTHSCETAFCIQTRCFFLELPELHLQLFCLGCQLLQLLLAVVQFQILVLDLLRKFLLCFCVVCFQVLCGKLWCVEESASEIGCKLAHVHKAVHNACFVRFAALESSPMKHVWSCSSRRSFSISCSLAAKTSASDASGQNYIGSMTSNCCYATPSCNVAQSKCRSDNFPSVPFDTGLQLLVAQSGTAGIGRKPVAACPNCGSSERRACLHLTCLHSGIDAELTSQEEIVCKFKVSSKSSYSLFMEDVSASPCHHRCCVPHTGAPVHRCDTS